KRDQSAYALQLRLDAADGPEASANDKKDQWLLSSAGDLSLFTLPNAKRAIYFYKKAAAAQGDFVLDSARKQLMLFAELGVLEANVREALDALPTGVTGSAVEGIDRLVLFTGHRIDSANRKIPRFPASQERVARNAIRLALEEEKNITRGSLLGVAGGANGGDLLFL